MKEYIIEDMDNPFNIRSDLYSVASKDRILIIAATREIQPELASQDLRCTNKFKKELTELSKLYAKVVVIFNRWYESFAHQLTVSGVDQYFFDYFALVAYIKIFINQQCEIKDSHTLDNGKNFLFILGKPNKYHRICLLRKLIEQGTIDPSTNYSLHVNNEDTMNSCQELLGMTHEQCKRFIKHNQKSLDLVFLKSDLPSIHYSGVPFDPEVFKNSNFQIVPETNHLSSNPWITEKTWVAIVNHMPFIIVGDYKMCEYLESKGFRTFRKYMLHSDYDKHHSIEKRTELAAENAEYWTKNIQLYHDEIQKDIEHNYQKYHEMIKKNLKAATDLVARYDINMNPVELFPGLGNNYPTRFSPIRSVPRESK